MPPAATPAHFVEHRSERLHLLVRGADHPPLALGMQVLAVREPLPWSAQAIFVQGIAALTGARALSEGFGREFGASPFVWLRQQRLLQGRHLVLDEGLPVALAAERLGFSSAAHFCTAFRAQFGETPGRLRQRLAQQAGQGGA